MSCDVFVNQMEKRGPKGQSSLDEPIVGGIIESQKKKKIGKTHVKVSVRASKLRGSPQQCLRYW